MKIRFAILTFVFLAQIPFLLGCSPTQSNRGNMVEDFRMAEVVPGVSTKTNVLQSLGSPTTTAPFDDNVWYYLGQKMEKKGIFDPKVTEEKIVVVAFGADEIVQSIDKVNSDRINVPKVRDKTPTSGNDLTLMEQLLGNVGRFNRGEDSAATTASGR